MTRQPRYNKILHHGDFAQDDPVYSAWVKHFTGHGHDSLSATLQEIVNCNNAALLLACLSASMRENTLGEIMRAPVDKILYMPIGGRDLAPYMAIEYCKNCRVLDLIGGNLGTNYWRESRLLSFTRRLDSLCESEPSESMYDPVKADISFKLYSHQDIAFIATPYEPELNDGFERGARAALKGLGLIVQSPRNEYRMNQRISEKIQEMIRGSKLLIANMRHSKMSGFNANVFYEMGFGQGSGKLVLPFRHVLDKRDIPVDVRDREYIPYEDELDVAMQLYWGLKPLVNDVA